MIVGFKDYFDRAYNEIMRHNIRSTIGILRDMGDTWSFPEERVVLDNITNDYQLLLDYWRKGFEDPQREIQYEKILERLSRLLVQMHSKYILNAEDIDRKAVLTAHSIERLSVRDIRRHLEDYVSEVAMLSLEHEETREQKKRSLYGSHHDFMSKLFCRIFTMSRWHEDEQHAFQELVLSPTVDIIDAQIIVSAITLSGLDNWDVRKFRALLFIYKHTTDKYIRQRALVGWVLCYNVLLYYDRQSVDQQIIDSITTEYDAQQLVELQKQIVYCTLADEDGRKIHNEIMPNILKNQDFNITRNGIVEREHDPLEDILDPSAEDRRMEELESSIKKIFDMQKAGSDVYFGGFSQMKRFPFFYKLVNWFYPFTSDHPELQNIKGLENSGSIFEKMPNFMSMCNSDKYSFAYGLSMIFDKLTPEMREAMVASAEMDFCSMENADDRTQEMNIRRSYLGDLLRFYRLYPDKHKMLFPFDQSRALIFPTIVFAKTSLRDHYIEIGSFFRKKGCYEVLGDLLTIMEAAKFEKDLDYTKLSCNYSIEVGMMYNAIVDIDEYREIHGNNYAIDSLYIRALIAEENYETATEEIRNLQTRYPEKADSWNLNLALTLSKSCEYEDAMRLLYQLDFEEPDNIDVQRVLAWSLMGDGRLDEAEKVYKNILADARCMAQDILNAGYCYWFSHDNASAIEMFRKFNELSESDLSDEFSNDIDLLDEFVSPIEKKMMLDIVG